ncbi:hypothetical protein Sjap_020328 [Stephania japonica]|uniref:Uncharacterized protein n=1 Tax=Stephania japonica TaxID=461633 RepID=A0AAP0F9E9_9MAGN
MTSRANDFNQKRYWKAAQTIAVAAPAPKKHRCYHSSHQSSSLSNKDRPYYRHSRQLCLKSAATIAFMLTSIRNRHTGSAQLYGGHAIFSRTNDVTTTSQLFGSKTRSTRLKETLKDEVLLSQVFRGAGRVADLDGRTT